MKARCEKPQNKSYGNYGGRGIKVCERWQSFELFAADMGLSPQDRYTLDRIDNDGDYCPENCRWATPKQQGRNKRGLRLLTYEGRTQSLAIWAEETGISLGVLWARLNMGWSVKRSLTEPIHLFPRYSITFDGRTMNLRQWAKERGISYTNVKSRLKIGWSVAAALEFDR